MSPATELKLRTIFLEKGRSLHKVWMFKHNVCVTALAPFIGSLLSILLLGEPVTVIFVIATVIMAMGCWFAAK